MLCYLTDAACSDRLSGVCSLIIKTKETFIPNAVEACLKFHIYITMSLRFQVLNTNYTEVKKNSSMVYTAKLICMGACL